jgi:hypothetical protein
MATRIDTLKALEMLVNKGFAKEQATAIVEIVAESDDELVTTTELKTELSLLESRITNKIYAVGLTIAAVVLAAAVFL